MTKRLGNKYGLASVRAGFTLIELLVAISIVIFLSTVGMTSYRAAQKKGRDSKRKSDLEQVRAALEMYRSDNELYPIGDWGTALSALNSGGYLSTTPQDPKGYSYYYNSAAGYSYDLCAYLEAGGTDDCGSNCGSAPDNCNYKVTNP